MSDQERNYNDLFEIAIINSKPCTGELFNWAAFKASEVKEGYQNVFRFSGLDGH